MSILDMIINKQPSPPGAFPQRAPQPQPAPISTGSPVYQAPQPSFFERLGSGAMDYLSDPTNRARLAAGFNTMRLNPDPNIAKMAQSQIETQQAMQLLNQQGNRTAQALKAAAEQETDPARKSQLAAAAKMVLENPSLAKSAAAALFERPQRPSAFSEKMAAARAAYPSLSEAELMDKVLAPASTTTMVLGDAESAFQKEAGKGQAAFINKVAEGLPAAAQLETDVNRLMALSEAVEKGSLAKIPNTMRRLIPTGIDPTSDAYTSQMLGVAQGLRQAGTGAQSERDMDLLIARAGSIGSDITARRIAHQALIEKARIDREMGQIARQIQINAGNPEKVQELQSQLDQLLMRPAMTEQMKNYLNGLTPDFSLEDIDAELQRRGQ